MNPTPHTPGSPDAHDPGDDYLWDKSGIPDPDVVRLETLLAPVRTNKPLAQIPPPRDRSATFIPHPASDRSAHNPRDHRRRKNAWVLPALGTLALFAFMAIIAWPMRPWGAGTQTPTIDPVGPLIDGPLVMSDWTAAPTSGAPSLGPKSLAAPQPLPISQWIQTDSFSTATLTSTSFGTVKIQPNSRIRVKTVTSGQQWLELSHGSIDATITAPPQLFFVETPSAIAVDMGCAYTLEVNEQGVGALRVTAGWVELQKGSRAVRVTNGYVCVIRPKGPGTPVNAAASDVLVAAVERFDVALGSSEKMKSNPLADVLALAGTGKSPSNDALTLWHLLRDAPEEHREEVVERLASIVPPPPGVGKAQLLSLDPTALDQWWDMIRFR